jgi:hypothetical protein
MIGNTYSATGPDRLTGCLELFGYWARSRSWALSVDYIGGGLKPATAMSWRFRARMEKNGGPRSVLLGEMRGCDVPRGL